MSIADAIDQLDRLQNPEPWEPEITDAAWEALETAIEALKDIERIRKWMKGELHDHG
jgi:hypothetical protein